MKVRGVNLAMLDGVNLAMLGECTFPRLLHLLPSFMHKIRPRLYILYYLFFLLLLFLLLLVLILLLHINIIIKVFITIICIPITF